MNRKFEFEADLYASNCGYGKDLKGSLIKLFRESTAMVKPDIVYAWLKHSHPTIHERIENIDSHLIGTHRFDEDVFDEEDSEDIDSMYSHS